MGLHAVIIDLDELHDSFKGKLVYANDFKTNTAEGYESFKRHFYTHFQDSEAMEHSASCDCGDITDAHRIGTTCDNCGHQVVSSSNRPIIPSMWMKAPKEVSNLISPQLVVMLLGYLSTKEFNFLEYLINTSYNVDYNTIVSKETRRKLDKLLQKDFPRGLNNFVANFDEIFQFLLDANLINSDKPTFKAFVESNKHKLFPKHVPLPSKLCFVVESTTSGSYIDKPNAPAIEAALTFASLGCSPITLKPQVVQNRVATALLDYAKYHISLVKERLSQKPGIFRRHVLGGRLNFTARGVITSISDPHEYDELHIPWGMACQLLKYHLINKLKRKRRMTTRQAMSYIYSHVLQYCPLLDECFKEIIRESKYGKLPATLHRNPTLQRGSTQLLFISKVKIDLTDNSISLSTLILKAPNLKKSSFMKKFMSNNLSNCWELSLRQSAAKPYRNVGCVQRLSKST